MDYSKINNVPEDLNLDSILPMRQWFRELKEKPTHIRLSKEQFDKYKELVLPFQLKGIIRRYNQDDYLIPCS